MISNKYSVDTSFMFVWLLCLSAVLHASPVGYLTLQDENVELLQGGVNYDTEETRHLTTGN